MRHCRVAYSSDEWFHIYANSNNSSIHASPNGVAKIFMRSDRVQSRGPKKFVIVLPNDPDGYTPDEDGAMNKMIDLLNKEMGVQMPEMTLEF